MFLNILRISASNVFETFLNMVVIVECTVVVFYSHKPTGSTNQPEAQIRFIELVATMAGKKEIQ